MSESGNDERAAILAKRAVCREFFSAHYGRNAQATHVWEERIRTAFPLPPRMVPNEREGLDGWVWRTNPESGRLQYRVRNGPWHSYTPKDSDAIKSACVTPLVAAPETDEE